MPTSFLPNEDEVYRIYKLTQKYLTEMGYEQYEISNFARKGCECKHNIGYWTRENYLGLGLGAASLLDNVRYSNTTDIHEYMDIITGKKIGSEDECVTGILSQEFAQEDGTIVTGTNLHEVAEKVTRKAQMEEYMFLGLRMKQGVTREGFLQAFGVSIEGIYNEVLEHLRAECLLEMSEGRIYLTEKGMDLGNYSMSRFLL
jgi:oxygen-independent coproporphyrinogen-3 oxidase